MAGEFGGDTGDVGEDGALFARHGGLWCGGGDGDVAFAVAAENGAGTDEGLAGFVADVGCDVGDVAAGAQGLRLDLNAAGGDGADEDDVQGDELSFGRDFMAHGAVSERGDETAERCATLEPVGRDGDLPVLVSGF